MSHWDRFQKYFVRYSDLGFSIDISRMAFEDSLFTTLAERIECAMKSMDALEAGAIANPDEKRMVGHYWLRNSQLAPSEALKLEIDTTLEATLKFAKDAHAGVITAANGKKFTRVLVVGIGGSALGPQLVAHAITPANPPMAISFFDNTDPDGIDRVVAEIGDELATTLTLVISKSGGTKETRNGMLEAEAAYKKAGLEFAKHAVAVTGDGSELDKHAKAQGWLAGFPMWDWVGGRTSVMSAVGTIAAALQGVDVRQFLAGAAAMDAETRIRPARENAAMLLALMWYHAGKGKGLKDMVVLPYKDRLVLFSKYLQQLVMESLGKEHDLSGAVVNQGIAVYGNKGSTDQHAYVQQLRDGVNNFFATFIEVRKARDTGAFEVEPGFTSGDYLQGFLRGTRKALAEKGRESITLSIAEINAFSLGMLIGLFERAVGFYAGLVNINAYHQPGVEAGKKAATEFLTQLAKVRDALTSTGMTADEVSAKLGIDAEDAFHMLNHLTANGLAKTVALGVNPVQDQFAAS
ncbi:glucose-6-phosphate isomerase [Prosthecobacter sp.]|uniref:glucose-6-phosphate isomerase n=1 Tax=Prosthecobacter sp. TaxID=1965333 RepID=UPI001DB22547|nr:glucose-6-phosphate isomerase [Prosthecobacter sp.]MCB1275753.1 glucose-6-phosphate isomerase [Prosthecobacter sp.]